MKPRTLAVNEIFYSIQGESTHAGLPCLFVRLTGCPLRCVYCDSEYAFTEGAQKSFEDIRAEMDRLAPDQRLVEITGGEPLAQPPVHAFMKELADDGYTVLLETSGACDIGPCDERVVRILDLKTPGSGERERNLLSNLDHLRPHDEVKFVITDRADYAWAKEQIQTHRLAERVRAVLLSAAHPMEPGEQLPGTDGLPLGHLAEWVLADSLPVRLQDQLHKRIWDPSTRGV